ncbi:heterokaryon incompatibility protein-domain-containing protein [Aspergillus carlsbadensis]|nr:heterokaryon incompatibility protein-domain-containing protein [Aspergillus carlsbadensis]
MPFPKTGCKYIWLDNCCINKPDTGELTESLASMGEWYANAAFCLVHLDNDRSPNDWLDEWDLWRREKGDSGVSEKPPNPEKPDDSANTLDDFLELAKRKNKHEDKSEDESDIRWATRGWTLQELVLSKMTYYVGPDWMPLSRNVQSLGQYYHLSPFVIASNPDVLSSTYVESEESKRLIDGLPSVTTANKNEVQLPENNLQNTEDRTRINSAHVSKTIIDILQEIGYLVPDGLDRESARSRIKLSIQATVAYLADYDSDSHAFKVLARLVVLYSGSSKSVQVPGKPDKSEKPDANWRKTAEKAIETLLIVLAKAEIKAIQDDRTYIAKFSNIADLVSWSEGTVTNRFSAHSVMYLASKRNVAKIVDKAYSLMGILGVRFPAFHAEGLTKALSRLMDEVVISSNDVSLFNWSGKHCGSPVRGRSLYASNIRGFEANFSPSKRFQTSRDLHMLHRRYVKNEGEKSNDVLSVLNKVIAWAMKASISYETVDLLKELSKHVLNADYKRLHEKLTTEFRQLTSELVASAEKSAKGDGNVPEARPTVEANTTATSQPADQGVPSNTAEYAENSRQSELGVDSSENAATEYRALDASQEPATPTSSISLEDQAQSQRKETDTTSFSSLGSKFKTKVKTQAVGLTQFNKPDPPAAQPEQETARKGDTTSKTSKQPTPEERLREHIEIFLEKKAPKNDGNTSAPINTSKSTSTDEEPKSDVDRDRPITCPNPIIVSGAGIQGVFDIQRVVVSMLDERELRLRIRNALSDYEMIDGWCTISTGLARIMVSFSCEKHILAQQMDLDYMIRNTVLSDPDKSSGDNQPDSWSAQSSTDTAHSSIKADSSSTQLNPDKAHSSINPDGSPTQSSTETAHPSDGPDSAQGNVPDTTPTELKPPSTPANPKRQDNDNRPREKRNIHRMLDYVTAPNLNEVAGEWVLARFSDSPNAKWFLCRLELGSSHQYYARRIPTDDFSFDHAIPEEQLVDYWRGFLREKKALLAETLRDVASRNKSANYVKFLTADLSRKFSGDKRDEDEIAAASTIKQAKVKVEAEISVPLAASADNAVAKEQILAAVQVSEAAVDETSGAAEGGETKPDAGTGGAAKPNEHTEKEKKYAKLSTSRQLLRLIWWSIYMHAHGGWADHVLRFLDEKALANVPPRLQSAVLAFHQSKPLLPRMYHAGKDVHFF